MSGLEVNKIIAAIIIAILVVILISSTGNLIVKKQGKQSEERVAAYIIDVPEIKTAQPEILKKSKAIEPISALLINASLEKGEKTFKKCGSCHNYKKGSSNKVGPNLWNIINSPKASADGFAYSKALAELGGKWTYEELSAFLYKPKEYIEETKMNFSGLKKVEDRANLILFLRNQSDNPLPLP